MHDPKRKAERGYTDRKSYVRYDGSEVLHGDDWAKRKLELIQRCAGICERTKILGRQHHPWCSRLGSEAHHIVKRWPKRDDRVGNLAWLSHWCHSDEDQRKIGGRK